MPWFHSLRRAAAGAAFASAAFAMSTAPGMANPLTAMHGSWSGGGQIRLEGGRSESIRCSANYLPRGSNLGLALRCASPSNRIELRASLNSRGNRVSGTWEERSYNASGNVSGIAAGNALRLSIQGGGLSGFMVVTTNGGSQSISVRTDNSALRGVNISMRRR